MRKAIVLFTCLLTAGVGGQYVAAEPPIASSPEFQEDSPSRPGARSGRGHESFPDRPFGLMGEEERNTWRKRRFWDMFEPSHEVRFATPELYIERYASRNIIDPKITVWDVAAERIGEKGVRLKGTVLWPEYAEGLEDTFKTLGFDPLEMQVSVLPSAKLGETLFGLVTTHTLAVRRYPEPKAEQVDQAMFGDGVRLLEPSEDGQWLRVIVSDGYIGWASETHIRRVDRTAWDAHFLTPTRWARLLSPVQLTQGNEIVANLPAASSLPVLGASDTEIRGMTIRGALGSIDRRDPGAAKDALFPVENNGADSSADTGGSVVVGLPFAPPNNKAVVPAALVREFTPLGEDMVRDIRRIGDPLLGVAYVWGGVSEKGIDCSGFTQYVYRTLGTALARDADEQSIGGHLVYRRGESLDSIRPGDLLFFINNTGRVSHVAMSLGGTEYMHASGGKVSLGSLDPASPRFNEGYLKKIAFAKRIVYGK